MAVPENIRKVSRPLNTIVEDNGREDPNRYSVKKHGRPKKVRDPEPEKPKRSRGRPRKKPQSAGTI